MKSQLKKRPQSTKIRTESGNVSRRANAALGEDYFKKGKVQQLAGSHQRAIELYTLAATCKTNYFQAYCNMGYCYRALGKFGEAKRSYQSALYSNSLDPISHFNLANLYRVMGENELAIEEYSQVIALKQQGTNVGGLYIDSFVNIGICYKNKGAIDEAIRVNRKVLEIDPNEGSALFNLAVCLLNSIQDKNTPYFHKVYHQRATEADGLFQNILRKDPESIMAQFCLAKVSTILNPNLNNIEEAIGKLKELLNRPRCDIKDEISQEIGRCLNLLKKFDESARFYEDSVEGITRRATQSKKKENNKIDNIFESFSHENIAENNNEGNEFLTEASGIALIERGNFELADKTISELPDGLLKRTLHLILELKIAEVDSDNVGNAIKAYNIYFNKSEAELPFEKLSLQAHKAIGKVLSLQQNYEQSIKHYEYVSQRIKNNRSSASAKLHSELGERFEEVGNRQKALEEYQKGIEIEPDNYSLSYSMGYCLFENGSYEEAKACFQRIIQRVRKDSSLAAQTKELYQTDCMIICALCSTQHSAATFDLFTAAYKKLQKLESSKQTVLQMQDENLLLFFIRISELYEQKLNPLLPEDPQFRSLAEMLITIYSSLLELTCCPDRNEVLTNSGILSYQLGHYATAAETYSQISSPHHLPALSLSLAYAHLIEPTLALKYVQQACQMEPNDRINLFCKDMLEWMYMGSNSGEWNKHLPAYKQDLFYERNQYGVGLLDKLSETINSPDYQAKAQDKLLDSLVKHQQKVKSKNPIINHKFQALQALSKKYDFSAPAPQKGILSPEVLKLCFTKSNNIQGDFAKLVQLLQSIPKCGQEGQFCEAALYLFIYYNQVESQAIQEALAKMVHRKKQLVAIDSTSASQVRPQIYSIYPDFTTAKEAIAVLREWESVLQSPTREALQILDDVYYRGNIRQPFEAQYHFPRHTHLLEEDQTFEKFISIVLNVMKYNKKLTCRGNNVKQLRTDLIKDFQIQFTRYLKDNTLHPITLSDSFLPITLYAVHETKKDCQDFINEVTKRMKAPEVTLQDCEQFIFVVNKVVRVRCRWNNPYEMSSIVAEVADNIIENPLFIVNQAIIYLESIIQSIKKDSPEASKYVSHDATLNF